MARIRVYGDLRSGNCYKVWWILNQNGLDYKWIDVDVLAGQTKRAEFLTLNPNGRIPVAVFPEKGVLTESNAILNYLAEGSSLFPDDRWQRAKVMQWQFFEQYNHEPTIAVNRFIKQYLKMPSDRQQQYERNLVAGKQALEVMEHQLQQTPFLCGTHATTADIALYAYTHVAHEGGFDLSTVVSIQAWIKRIESIDGHLNMAAASAKQGSAATN